VGAEVAVAVGAEVEVEVAVAPGTEREVEFRLVSDSGWESKRQNFLVHYTQPEKG
jgi:hypothetical protein